MPGDTSDAELGGGAVIGRGVVMYIQKLNFLSPIYTLFIIVDSTGHVGGEISLAFCLMK